MSDKKSRIPVHARLSTSDNPFDPFDEYDKWDAWDHLYGWNSAETVDRIAKISVNWPYEDQLLAYEDAVDKCVKENLTGNRIKVVREY